MKRNIRLLLVFLILSSCHQSEHLDELNYMDESAELMISKSASFISISLDSALFYAQQALKKSKAVNSEKGIANSKRLLGQISFLKGDFNLANTYLMSTLAIFKKTNDKEGLGKTYNHLGNVYQYSQQPDLAIEYFGLARTIFSGLNDSAGLAKTFGYIGHFHEKVANYDSAIHYQNKALEIYKEQGNSFGLAQIYDNIGSIYEDQQNFGEAIVNFNNAHELYVSIGNDVEGLINLNNIGDIYRKTGQFNQALNVTLEVLQIAKNQDQIYQIRSAYRDLGKVYQDMGEFDIAYQYLDSCYEVNGEIYNLEIAREIANTRAFYEVEQKEQQIALLEKDHKIDKVYQIALIIGTLLILTIGILVYMQQQIKFKKNKALFEAERDLTQANEKRLKAELEYNKLHEEKLEQEIKNQSRELTTNALQIIRKNEFLEGLINELKRAEKSHPDEIGTKIKKIRKSIDYNFSLDDDWQEFESIFQNVHQNFFNELRRQYPDLTSADIRLCAMLRLNLNSQDIAAIMGISQDSLRIARYRLRKKIGIAKGGNLYSYIMNIG